jgi:hypothetical protein
LWIGDGPNVLGIASQSSLIQDNGLVGYRVLLAYQRHKPSVTLVPKVEKWKIGRRKKLLTNQYQFFDVDYGAKKIIF